MEALFVWFHAHGIPASLDLLITLAVLVTASIYGMIVGRDRSVMYLLAVYISLAIVTNAPVFSLLSGMLRVNANPTLRLSWFLGVFFLMFVILWRSHLLRSMAREKGRWWETLLVSVLQIGLAVSVCLVLLPAENVSMLSPLVKELFLSDLARSFWLLAPVGALLVIGRGEGGDEFIISG